MNNMNNMKKKKKNNNGVSGESSPVEIIFSFVVDLLSLDISLV